MFCFVGRLISGFLSFCFSDLFLGCSFPISVLTYKARGGSFHESMWGVRSYSFLFIPLVGFLVILVSFPMH